MGSGYLLGILAFMTIGGVIVLSIVHFGTMMRDKKNRDHATNVLLEDGSSAHTAVRGGRTPEHMQG
jgi:hypothetical protein